MENAVKLGFRRVVYQFGLIWFLVNSLIWSIAVYLNHQDQANSILFGSPTTLGLISLVLGPIQAMLVKKYFQAHLHISKFGWWVFSMFIGFTLTFLTALASIIILGFPAFSQLGNLGTSVPPPPNIVSTQESFTLMAEWLFVIGSVIGGGITGLLQFVIIRKYVKFARLWIVATALSGGLNALMYLHFWSGFTNNESNRQNYNFIVAVTGGKIGVIYGLITGLAMMIMLQQTIEHQARSSLSAYLVSNKTSV